MIRHLMLSVCLVLATLPAVQAAPINGIRIESPHRRVVVFVDGQQVCLPTFSCFVANLRGICRVEVYEALPRGFNPRKGKLLRDERVHCSASKVKEILIEEEEKPDGNWGIPNPHNPHKPHKPGRPGDRPEGGRHEPVMSSAAFEQFMKLMEKQDFDSDRKAVLDNALQTSWFTTDQCIRLLNFCDFNSEKKQLMKRIYPKITDKPNFFYVIDQLTFSSDKEEINSFIKQYQKKNH